MMIIKNKRGAQERRAERNEQNVVEMENSKKLK